ncbi:polysaccharide deacetylase family protein [Paenibacillus sp. CMAA1739]|uniref:polysaccharide deacetylase family protein n=1 Tax=Paenibacillus ottowii TaxID=2315729 RepID=UPI0027303550|nr:MULTISPECIES: polysaccharide deacetylase family protein [Paenibacillus]MDP1510647.1 polysaccharide deacetylase family protein [Paenibacillus ottowii]MEC4566063.1 polysaccharide deacetylase family protein [Paenibacillus sp. CMAA1739]
MNNIAVMYHYVREQECWKGIVPMRPVEFAQQIDELSRTHEIISLDQIHEVRTKPWCILTFDDGTKDQYTHAFDILKQKGLPAYFTIMSGPLLSGNIPIMHLVHTVLSFKSDEEIWELLKRNYDTDGIEEQSSVYAYEQKKLRRYNKYMLNFRLSTTEARHFLESLFLSLFPDKSKFITDFYLTRDEIRKMSHEGMTIGVHCHKHSPYTGDPQLFYDTEIEPCKILLNELIGNNPKWYTPAFGGGNHFELMKEELTPTLLNNGFKGAFSTIPGNIKSEPGFWMDRIDCNKLPPLGNMNIL